VLQDHQRTSYDLDNQAAVKDFEAKKVSTAFSTPKPTDHITQQ